jgi:DNA-binding CsgD family transcriptional regulator
MGRTESGEESPPLTDQGFDFAHLPVVGRERVQETLLRGLQAAAKGEGETVLLTGEPGSGKTHVCRFLQGRAERKGFTVCSGRAYRAESGIPYSLFSDTFLPLLRSLSPDSLNILTRGGVAELEYLFPTLPSSRESVPKADAESSKEFRTRILWSFSELLQELSGRDPLLVIMEDLQWADPSSLEITHFLARQLSGHPVFLLLTREDRRSDEDPALAEMERSLIGQGVARELPLPSLTRKETGLLLHRAFGVSDEVAGEFTDRLHQWTQGNPFFLEETLRNLVRSKRLYRKGGAWLGWEVRELELSGTVREAVVERLGDLPSEARSLVDLAGILGVRAPFSLLRALSPLPEAELLSHLDLLVKREVLTEGLDGDGVVFDFRQPLVREAVLAQMGLARSRILHGRVATTLEEFFREKARDHAAVLAYHHHRAAGEGSPEAIQYLAQAGHDALRRFGNAEAAQYLKAALAQIDQMEARGEPLPELEAGRRGLLRDLARALSRIGEYEEATPLWEEVSRWAEEEGVGEEWAEARRRIGIIKSNQGDLPGALEEYQGILAAPSDSLSPSLRAKARLRLGIVLEELGRLEEAESTLEDVLQEAEDLQDPVLLAQAHRALVLLHIWTGHPDRVRVHADRAMELARDSGARSVEFWTLWGKAVLEGLLGNTDVMAELVRESERVARELRSPILRLRSLELAIEHAAATGEWESGIALGEQAIALARGLSQNTILPRVLVWTSLIYLARGEVDLARPLVWEAWVVSGAGEDGTANIHGVIPAHIGMGYLALTELDYDEAIRFGEAGLKMADKVGYGLWAIHRLLPLIAEAHLWKGDLEGARKMGKRLREGSTGIGHRLGLAWADSCDALITWLAGDVEGALQLMEDAARALEDIPMIGEAARLRRLKAGRLADVGDRKGALEELTRVHEIFLRLGAEVELEKTRGMFRELDARPPRRAPAGGGTLSAREIEIAGLVKERMSNKAIARKLGISARTVSTHLSNIYQKLGIGSRGELADLIRSDGWRGK